MDEHYDVDKFISLVKSKESVWNYKSKVYSNKLQRIDDWIAICECMVDDFKEKTNGERNAIVHEYQAKWKVLRDGFTRCIKNYRKKGPPTSGRINRSKLYTYYNQLQFLNDLYDDEKLIPDDENLPSNLQKDTKVRKRFKKFMSEVSSDDLASESVSEPKKKVNTEKERQESIETEFDEDRQFLLSLLSDFRKIHEDRKLDAKGDIINVIRHYRNATSTFQTRGSYYSNDIAALATTATERPPSKCSSDYEYPPQTSPPEIKFVQEPSQWFYLV